MSAVNISTASVPASWCNLSLQEIWPKLVSLIAAELAGANNTFNDGDTTPVPDDQDKPWTPPGFSGSNPPAAVYHYINGAWIMPHPIAPGLGMMYWGTELSITTLDGGEAGVVTETTGPMWEKVSALDGRIPMGPGTLQPSTRTLSVTGTLGADEHTLTRAELPNVQVDTPLKRRTDLVDGGNSTALFETSFTLSSSVSVDVPAEPLGDGEAHENLPPVYGTWFIRRTARKYYRR